MGLVYTNISLSNPRDPTLKAVEVEALVDTGATTLCIPEHIAIQLQLPAIEQREVVRADGKSHLVSYVGPIQVQFEHRTCFTGALVLVVHHRDFDRQRLLRRVAPRNDRVGRHCERSEAISLSKRLLTYQNFCGHLLGDSVLMGAVPMEDMDLVVNPREQKVTVNPKSPNIPSAIVK